MIKLRFIKIKYFPSNFISYANLLLVNLVFNFVCLLLLLNINSFRIQDDPFDDFFLVIPKNIEDFSEKKDLIFKKLSLEKNIVSLSKINKSTIKSLLGKSLDNTEIPDNLIPDVYTLKVQNKNQFDSIPSNRSIKQIIPNAKIYKRSYKRSFILNHLYLLPIIFTFYLVLNILLLTNSIENIKKSILISNIFGATRNNIFYNLGLGYMSIFILAILITFFSYLVTNHYGLLKLFQINEELDRLFFLIYAIFILMIKSFTIILTLNFKTKKIYN